MRLILRSAILFTLILVCTQSNAQLTKLNQRIMDIGRRSHGMIGVGIKGIEDDDELMFNEDHRFPMQSVFKFPLAMAVLDQVDKGKLRLGQKVLVTKEEVSVKTWSPIREKYPEGNIELTIAELLSYTVSQSDNIGCDILFRLAGGTEVVNTYIHGLGVEGIAIKADEKTMATAWDVQFKNYCQPPAMVKLLELMFQRKTLSAGSHDFLWKIMTETTTGPNQIRGQLPKELVVAHKTGSSGTNNKGITAAMNDVGIVQLPNGKHFIVVVFMTNSTDSKEVRDKAIADIAKAAYDHFNSI